ncbi:MAG: hypothetical protein ACPHQP_01055 [Longimicrobiales bacterium]
MSRVYLRYGNNFQSVSFEFEAKALNEVGFRRDRESTFPVDDLAEGYDLLETVEMTAEAEGDVQSETEQLLLDRLKEQAQAAVDSLPEGGIAVVANERGGRDQPKPRQTIGNVVVEGENRLHFTYHVDPPLRLELYRAKG